MQNIQSGSLVAALGSHLGDLLQHVVRLLDGPVLRLRLSLEDAQRLEHDVAPQVGEHGGSDPPGLPPLADRPAHLLLDLGRVDGLVEAALDVPARDVLELAARLDEEVSPRNRDLELLAVGQPDVESGVAALAVDGHEAEVVVDAGEGLPRAAPPQVVGVGGQLVRPASQLVSDRVLGQAESEGQHLGGRVDGVEHAGAPVVEDGFDLREVLGDHVAGDVGRDCADVPEEAQFGERLAGEGRENSVLVSELLDEVGVVEGLEDVGRSEADLVFLLGVDVDLESLVELSLPLGEVPLQQIQEGLVLLLGDPGILHDHAAELVKRSPNQLAILLTRHIVEEVAEVDSRNLFEELTKPKHNSLQHCFKYYYKTKNGFAFIRSSQLKDKALGNSQEVVQLAEGIFDISF